MKKWLSLALTLCAATALPASALAANADLGTTVFGVGILSARDRLENAGTWVLELDSDVAGVYGACEYAVTWSSPFGGPDLGVSTDCILDEMKVHGRRSCLRNGFVNFPTIVDLDPACECAGFDENGLLWDILDIRLTEGLCGFQGVIVYDSPFGGTYRGVQISQVGGC